MITGKGRSLIALATTSFDSFLGSRVIFLSMTECIVYIKNILNESFTRKFNDNDYLDRDIERYELKNLLLSYFDDPKECDHDLLDSIILNLSREDINRIYYKNNLYAFCSNSIMKKILRKIILEEKQYTSPKEETTPENLKALLDDEWNILEEYVFYKYPFPDAIYKVIKKKRKVVLVIDTDS